MLLQDRKLGKNSCVTGKFTKAVGRIVPLIGKNMDCGKKCLKKWLRKKVGR